MVCRALDLANLVAGFLGLVSGMLNPRPSSLPDESSRSDDELELLHAEGSDAEHIEDVVEASSCKSSSSLMGNSRRCASRQLRFSSISKS